MKTELIQKFLDKASEAYYLGKELLIDNDQFDRLANVIKYTKVGYKAEGETAKHQYQMYSLNKHIGTRGEMAGVFDNSYDLTETFKLDGAAISLLYVDGELVQALTRGDGIVGNIITDKVRFIKNIPVSSVRYNLCFQITGEVVTPKENMNSRNYCAGALALKSEDELKTRDLRFIAYDVQPKLTKSYSRDLRLLEDWGFVTVVSKIDFDQYPHDGIVLRVDDNFLFDRLGYTAHHPRGAIAIKERKPSVITTLLDVVWQVGKSGRVTPVAILEPVDINGAIVTRATLNNVNFLKSLDLYKGCKVEVIRSGEIIPTIIGRAQ